MRSDEPMDSMDMNTNFSLEHIIIIQKPEYIYL